MLYYLNNILLNNNEDTEVWMQILVYIVFAVIWLLGTISKKVQKNQQQKGDQQQKKFEVKYKSQFKNKKAKPHSRPVTQSKKPQRPITSPADSQLAINPSKLSHIKRLKSKIKKLETPVAAEIEKIQTKPAYAKQPKPKEKSFQHQIIADLTTDTDSLRKAILYHEILGKPVGLRDFQ